MSGRYARFVLEEYVSYEGRFQLVEIFIGTDAESIDHACNALVDGNKTDDLPYGRREGHRAAALRC